MFKDKMNFKLLNILVFASLIYLCIITFNVWGSIISKIIAIIIPFLIAFSIAYAFYPLVKRLKKKGISNGLSVTIVAGSVILIMIILVLITVPLVYDQLVLLSQSITEVLSDLSEKLRINFGDFQNTISGVMDNIIQSAGRYLSNGTFNIVGRAVDFLSDAIIILILSIYFLADMERIRTELSRILRRGNSEKRRRAYEYVKALDTELGKYLTGLVLFVGIQFVEYSLIFLIIGHPNWLLLGILASITTVIPYFGGLITNIIAVILASVVSTPLFIATLIVCLIFPNIDGYIISPKVYGKTNNVNAMWTIFAVVVGGKLLGIPGIIMSLPVYILLNCTYKFFKNDIYDTVSNIKNKDEAKKEEKRKRKILDKLKGD